MPKSIDLTIKRGDGTVVARVDHDLSLLKLGDCDSSSAEFTLTVDGNVAPVASGTHSIGQSIGAPVGPRSFASMYTNLLYFGASAGSDDYMYVNKDGDIMIVVNGDAIGFFWTGGLCIPYVTPSGEEGPYPFIMPTLTFDHSYGPMGEGDEIFTVELATHGIDRGEWHDQHEVYVLPLGAALNTTIEYGKRTIDYVKVNETYTTRQYASSRYEVNGCVGGKHLGNTKVRCGVKRANDQYYISIEDIDRNCTIDMYFS